MSSKTYMYMYIMIIWNKFCSNIAKYIILDRHVQCILLISMCGIKDVTSVIYLRYLINRFWIYSLPYRILRRTTRAARWRYKTSVSSPWPQTTLIVPYRAYWSTGRTTIHGWTRLSMTTIAGFTWKGTTWTTSPTVPGNCIKSFTVESLNLGVAQSSWNSWVHFNHN